MDRKEELDILLGALQYGYEVYRDKLGEYIASYSNLDDKVLDKFFFGVLDELKKTQEKFEELAYFIADPDEVFIESAVPLQIVLHCDSSPGAIPVGGKLIYSTHWLEMIGTHEFRGTPVHPMTISLNKAAKAKLDKYSYVKIWKLVANYGNCVTVRAISVDDLADEERKAYDRLINKEIGKDWLENLRFRR